MIKIPSAFLTFYSLMVFFFLMPAVYILFTGEFSNLYIEYSDIEYESGLHLFLVSVGLSFVAFFIAYSAGKRRPLLFLNININRNDSMYGLHKKYIFIRKILLPIVTIMVFVFFYKVGFQKLSLLGTEMDAWQFRMIGFDDTSRILIAFNELARRVILPFFLVIELLNVLLVTRYKKKYFYFVLFLFAVGIVNTLDRAPLMTLMVLFIYIYIAVNPSIKKMVFGSFIALLSISILASLMTYFQYNILDFDLMTIINSALDFIMHRVLMVPTHAALELSYIKFPMDGPFLNFQYTRLGALFGMEYVGTEMSNSVYVAPVGYIADSWRNLGFFGVLFTSILLGFFASFVDRNLKKLNFYLAVVVSFMFVAFTLFLIFGVFYSQGSFVQMAFIGFIILVLNKDIVRNRRKI